MHWCNFYIATYVEKYQMEGKKLYIAFIDTNKTFVS